MAEIKDWTASGGGSGTSITNVTVVEQITQQNVDIINQITETTLQEITNVNNYYTEVQQSTGFADPGQSTIAFSNENRRFTVTPVGDSFTIYSFGTRLVKSAAEYVDIDDTVGQWFFYYTSEGVLSASQTLWDFSSTIPIGSVYWDGSSGTITDDRAKLLDYILRLLIDDTQAVAWVSGGLLSGYTEDTDTDAAVQVGLSNLLLGIYGTPREVTHAASPDEDWEQILSDPAQLPVWYKSGSAWTHDTATNFPFKNTTSGRVNYNNASAGSQVETTNNYYVAYFIFATSKPTEPIIVIQGQRQDSTEARATKNNTVASLITAGLPFTGMKALWKVVLHTSDSYTTGARKATVAAVEDLRGTSAGAIQLVVNHSELEGLTTSGHPDSAITEKPFVACASWNGKPSDAAFLMILPITESDVSLPQSLTGSYAKAGTAATAQTDFTVYKNGDSIGTITFAAEGTVATFTFASAVSFVAGDLLKIKNQATADATLADIGIALRGTRG